MGTYNPFPNVPFYPGVPSIPRSGVALPTLLTAVLGTTAATLLASLQQPTQWGIFDVDNNLLGISSDSNAVLSTYAFEYGKEAHVSGFPIEKGSFANFNKVETPGSPVVTLSLDGTLDDRTAFLAALDAACKSTNLYSVVTPEVTYVDYSLTRYTYSRRAGKGATLLTVDVTLEEIRQVSATFAIATTPVVAPQTASASPQVANGMVQAVMPPQSTLKSLVNQVGSLFP